MGTKRRNAGGEEVYSITSARRALSEDLHDRNMRYLFSMAVRTIFFVLMVVTPAPWRWVFAVGAVVIPYIAVTVASAGREAAGKVAPEQVYPEEAAAVQLYDPTREFLR